MKHMKRMKNMKHKSLGEKCSHKHYHNFHEFTVDLLQNSQQGKIIKIKGTKNFILKLESLGVRESAIVSLKSTLPMGGPIIIKIGNTEIAIGRKMAKHIIVEVLE